LTRLAGASYVHLKTAHFQEDGNVSNLTGLSGTTDLTTTTLGLRASHDDSALPFRAVRPSALKACRLRKIRGSSRSGLILASAGTRPSA
jgi:uncharacterized protein with beta-barrel porin domain